MNALSINNLSKIYEGGLSALQHVNIDVKTGEAYFLAKGKPYVTIKFPWSEIAIIIIMLVIIVRLLFKKQVLQTEKEIKEEVDKILKIGKDTGYELADIGIVETGERQVIFEPENIILTPPGK